MLRKPIVRNLDLYYGLLLYLNMYSVICICHNAVCYRIIADKILYLWVVKGDYHFPKSIPGRLLFTRVSQELVKHILRRMKYDYGWLFVFRFYGPVNSPGHVKHTSHPLTLLRGRIRQTKRLTSTSRAYARGSNWQLPLGQNGRVHNVSVISSRLKRAGPLEKEDRIDEIKYSPPVPHFLQPPNYTHEIYKFALKSRNNWNVVVTLAFHNYIFIGCLNSYYLWVWPTIKTSSLRFWH